MPKTKTTVARGVHRTQEEMRAIADLNRERASLRKPAPSGSSKPVSRSKAGSGGATTRG